MAGDDEELSMLLSTISDPVGANVDLNQILYMNGINGEHQYQTLDQVSQILNIPSLPRQVTCGLPSPGGGAKKVWIDK